MMARANSVIQQAQLHVDLGRRPLDQRHAPDESRQGLHARDREVLQRALRLRRIERPFGTLTSPIESVSMRNSAIHAFSRLSSPQSAAHHLQSKRALPL